MATAAQKTARANFKKAIEYRKKTGVTLKEAFAEVNGKKTSTVSKKKVMTTKKVGATNITSKIANNLADQLVDKLDSMTFDDFVNSLGVVVGVARDAGFGYAHTRVAVKTMVEQFIDQYKNEF